MARQNVGNPKFYIDLLSYWKMSGNIESVKDGYYTGEIDGESEPLRRDNIIGLNPTKFLDIEVDYSTISGGGQNTPGLHSMIIDLKENYLITDSDTLFFGVLGHNFREIGSTNYSIQEPTCNFKFYSTANDPIYQTAGDMGLTDDVINWYGGTPLYDGWSLGTTDDVINWDNYRSISKIEIDTRGVGIDRLLIGSLAFGYVFQMDHSPELSLTLSREYDGIKTQETRGGSTLRQINYAGAPDWAYLPAWELSSYEPFYYNYRNKKASRGRRTWELQFNYIDSSNLMSINELMARHLPDESDEAGYDDSDFDDGEFSVGSQTDRSFFGSFMEKTMGGALPFIFQPDGNNNSPDQFALCTIDQDAIAFTQVAPSVYDVSLKIREVW